MLLVNTCDFMSVDMFTNSYLNKINTPICTKRNSGFITIPLLLLYENTLNIEYSYIKFSPVLK